VAIALAAISLRHLRPWMKAARVVFRELALLAKANPVASVLLGLLLLLSTLHLVIPLVDSDGLRYHAALPKLYLLSGEVFLYEWDFTAAYPQLGEMLFMLLMPAGGGEMAKFVHFGFFLASIAVLMLLLHEDRRTRAAAMLGAMLFAAAPVVIAPAPAAFVDHIVVYHLGVALLLAMRSRAAAATGLSLGAAVATKLTAAPVAALLALAVAFRPGGASAASRPTVPKTLLQLSLAALLVTAPFLIRNIVETGDPIYPIGYGLAKKVAPSLEIPADLERYFDYTATYNKKIEGVVGIPWWFTPGVSPADEVAGIHHLLGLFALVIAIRKRSARMALLLVLPFLAIALFSRPPVRYFLPMLWALAAFEAWALAPLRRWLAVALAVLAATPAMLHSAQFFILAFHPLPYIRGVIDRETYLRGAVLGYPAAEWINRQGRRGRVMALDFPSPYYFDREWVAEGIQNDPLLMAWVRGGIRSEEMVGRLERMGIAWIVVTPGYGGGRRESLLPLASSEEEAREVMRLRERLRLAWSERGTDIYEVPYSLQADSPGGH
jgi:hypothetical protein